MIVKMIVVEMKMNGVIGTGKIVAAAKRNASEKTENHRLENPLASRRAAQDLGHDLDLDQALDLDLGLLPIEIHT